MPTRVKHPMHHLGQPPYKTCTYCGEKFTPLGLSRHWDKCKKNPKLKRSAES